MSQGIFYAQSRQAEALMPDFHRTALLLEEKAAWLPRDDPRRAHLLQSAQVFRLLGWELMTPDYEFQESIGSFRKRAYVCFTTAAKMPDGPDRWHLEQKACRAALHDALSRLGVGIWREKPHSVN
jgi:hypothetical protein